MEPTSPYKSKSGFARIRGALCLSLDGLRAAYRSEFAFRQEIFLACVLVPVAALAPVSLVYKALMISSVLIVLVTELLNSAVEATVDRISIEEHALAKSAKDIGSAAVLVSLLNCAVVWGMAFWERFG